MSFAATACYRFHDTSLAANSERLYKRLSGLVSATCIHSTAQANVLHPVTTGAGKQDQDGGQYPSRRTRKDSNHVIL